MDQSRLPTFHPTPYFATKVLYECYSKESVNVVGILRLRKLPKRYMWPTPFIKSKIHLYGVFCQVTVCWMTISSDDMTSPRRPEEVTSTVKLSVDDVTICLSVRAPATTLTVSWSALTSLEDTSLQNSGNSMVMLPRLPSLFTLKFTEIKKFLKI